jgi:predicted NAD/FAD-dependent oxidoreductase
VPVVTRHRASAIVAGPDRWAVTYETDRDPDEADAIVATPPVPQTVELLRGGATMPGGEIGTRLESIRYHEVIGILELLDRSPGLPDPGALQRPDHPVATFVADNQAKGISVEPALTVHLAHALSAELWGQSDDEVLARVADELADLRGPAQPIETQVKRWRYATPVAAEAEPLLTVATEPGLLLLAGDAFGGSKVEGAFLSGAAAADAILADL